MCKQIEMKRPFSAEESRNAINDLRNNENA